MYTLIAPENTWAIWAVMSLWVAASIALEYRYRWVARISGPVLVMLGAIVLANLRIIPTEAPAYDAVWDYAIPVCVPLLLFRANIFAIIRDSGRLFLTFHLAAAGTVVGSFVAFGAFSLLSGEFDVPEGIRERLPELSGIMTGSYTGGSVNFISLSRTYDPERSWAEITNSLIVADNLVMALVFVMLFSMVSSPLFRRAFRAPHEDAAAQEDARGDPSAPRAAEHWKPKPIALRDIALALGIAVSIAACGSLAAGALGESGLPAPLRAILGQPYLMITALCVVVATCLHRQLSRIAGAEELGMYLIYLFFFAIGTAADVARVVTEVPLLFAFCGIMALSNVGATLGLGLLFRRSIEEIALASNATLGGAPSAAAMAVSRGWNRLILPGFLVGIWGYVVGTYLGLLVGEILGAEF